MYVPVISSPQKTIWCVLGHLLNAQNVREHVEHSLTETTDLKLVGLTLIDLTVKVSGVVAEPDDSVLDSESAAILSVDPVLVFLRVTGANSHRLLTGNSTGLGALVHGIRGSTASHDTEGSNNDHGTDDELLEALGAVDSAVEVLLAVDAVHDVLPDTVFLMY